MENAVYALKMAFAAFVFVIAIALAFTAFSQAREVADLILYTSDKTNYEQYISDSSSANRIVGVETVIALARRYNVKTELYSVKVLDKNGNIIKTSDGLELVFDLLEDSNNNLTPTEQEKNFNKKLSELRKSKYSSATFEEFFKAWQETRRKTLYRQWRSL